MKKSTVYTMAALLSLATLAGCGRMGDAGETMRPTERPTASASPMIGSPDPADGYVRDEDGIITDGDTGRDRTDRDNTRPAATANPGTAMNPGTAANPGGTANGGTRTASPSPSASAGTGTN